MKALTPLFSLSLGLVTGFFYRDELYFPTNMRIKVAILEHHMLTRQKLNTDLLDIVDHVTEQTLVSRSQKILEAHDKETSLLILILSLAMLFASAEASLVGRTLAYFYNIYVYYTWNTTFLLCAFWGYFGIVVRADRGLAYISCMNNFQQTFPMNQDY